MIFTVLYVVFFSLKQGECVDFFCQKNFKSKKRPAASRSFSLIWVLTIKLFFKVLFGYSAADNDIALACKLIIESSYNAIRCRARNHEHLRNIVGCIKEPILNHS